MREILSAHARRTAAAGLLMLAACASPPPKDHPPEAGPAQNDAAADASFDWHPLVAAPFGTLLKDSPIRLHEVLLFREQSHEPAEIESKDCYAVDGTPPTFVAITGTSHAIASRAARPHDSSCDGNKNRSASESKR